MESEFIQLSDYVQISISKNWPLWLVLWSRVTYIYNIINIYTYDWEVCVCVYVWVQCERMYDTCVVYVCVYMYVCECVYTLVCSLYVTYTLICVRVCVCVCVCVGRVCLRSPV